MRKRKMVVKGLKKPRTPDEVLGLLVEGLATVLSARKSGSAVGENATSQLQEFVEAMKELEPREALHILWMEPAELHVARQLVPIDTFPTKKVRFNVFPQSEDKLARVKQYKEDGKATMKDAVDTVLECLLNQLPSEYWDHKADVVTLLAGHLPSPGGERPVSLAMNSLMYAFLQEVAEMLGQSQGAVLEAAAEMWLTDHKRRVVKREEALKIITQLISHAGDVEDHLKKILEDDDPVCSRFGMVMLVLENLHAAIESNIREGVPIDPEDISQNG